MPVALSLMRKLSPVKTSMRLVGWKAVAASTGKSFELVVPATWAFPAASTAMVLARSVSEDLVLTVLVWTSPVLYPWQQVAALVGDSWLLTAYQLNPLTVAVELVHRGTWATTSPENLAATPPGLLWHTVFAFVVAAVLVGVGRRVFRVCSGRFAQEL